MSAPEDAPVWEGGLCRAAGLEASTDRNRLDRAVILNTLADSYWAGDLAPEQILESIANSIAFGLYDTETGRQAGFARVVSDMARFAWVSDVFVVAARRGQGAGSFLMRAVLAYPPLAPVGTWTLATRDAQEFYARFGFRPRDARDVTLQLRRGRSV